MKNYTLIFFFSFVAIPLFFCQDLKLGDQEWAAKDLNATKYRNGDPILKAESSSEWRKAAMNKIGAYCTYNGQILYNWYAVNDSRLLAPNGYYIPNNDEWMRLLISLGGLQLEPGVLQNSGFYDVATGSRNILTGFDGYGRWSSWWSSDKLNEDKAYCCQLYSKKGAHLDNLTGYMSGGCAVRCVKNKSIEHPIIYGINLNSNWYELTNQQKLAYWLNDEGADEQYKNDPYVITGFDYSHHKIESVFMNLSFDELLLGFPKGRYKDLESLSPELLLCRKNYNTDYEFDNKAATLRNEIQNLITKILGTGVLSFKDNKVYTYKWENDIYQVILSSVKEDKQVFLIYLKKRT